MQAEERSMHLADKFERGLVLRVGRAVPLTLAAAACLALAGAVAVLLYTAIPTRGVREPAAVVVPAEVAVTAADIRAALAPPPGAAPASTSASAAAGQAPADSGPSEGARAVALAVHQIRALIPESTAPWRDVYQRGCRQYFFGTCYGEYQRMVARGISSHLTAVTDPYDAPDSRAEVVPIRDTDIRYLVNGSNAGRKVAVLNEARAILQESAGDARPHYLRAWSSIRVEKEAARQESIRAEEMRVARERAEENTRVDAAQISKSAARTTALTTAAAAIGLLWTIALALGILAIERNTRALLLGRDVREGHA